MLSADMLPKAVLVSNIVVKGLILINYIIMISKSMMTRESVSAAEIFVVTMAILITTLIALFFIILSYDIVACLVSHNRKKHPLILFSACQHVGVLVALMILLSLAWSLMMEIGHMIMYYSQEEEVVKEKMSQLRR